MPDLVVLVLAATATMLATGLGVLPVLILGSRAVGAGPLMWGIAAGSMVVASALGLLVPAFADGSVAAVIVGVLVGIGFVVLAHRWADRSASGHGGAERRRAFVVIGVLTVHSLPEGLAMGSAWASTTTGLGAFVVAAIAVQNIPEGTAAAMPLHARGVSAPRQIGTAVLTGAPQPLGAVVAYLAVEQAASLLPVSLAFAAGAMLWLVLRDLGPRALAAEGRRGGSLGIVIGAVVMIALSQLIGV